MKTLLRKAVAADAAAFVNIKNQLPLTMSDGSISTGGFLLGTNENIYREYIDSSYCLVAETGNEVTGFGIIFPDHVLRSSDIWLRRNSASWFVDLAAYELQNLCYFEQFAFLPGHRRTAIALAYNITRWAFTSGHNTLFTTTVNKPIRNLAAVPFINAAGGIKAGNIDEIYPVVGHINSDIYLLHAADFYNRAQCHPLYPFLAANTIDLA